MTTSQFCPSTQVSSSDNIRPGLMNFVKRVAGGMGALSLSGLANVVTSLCIVPVALAGWGRMRYGEWVLLIGMVQVLRLSDLGVQTFVVNELCAAYARKDWKELQRLLHSALLVQLAVGCGGIAVVTVAILVLPLNRLLGVRTVSGAQLFWVCLLLSVELLTLVPVGTITGIYRATGYLARGVLFGTARQVLTLVFCVVLIMLHHGFAIVAAARVFTLVLVTVFQIGDLHRLHPWLEFWPRTGDWSEGLHIAGRGLFFLAIPLANYIGIQLVLLMVQRSFDGGEVSRLSTEMTLANSGQMVSNFLVVAVWPEITSLYALGHVESLRRLHLSFVKFNLWLVIIVACAAFPCITVAYPLWTARTLVLDKELLALLFFRLILWAAWYPSLTILLAINRHYRVAVVLTSTAILACVLGLVLVPRVGIRGAALAWLIADFVGSFWAIPWMAAREIGGSFCAVLRITGYAAAVFLVPVSIAAIGREWIYNSGAYYSLVIPACIFVAAILLRNQLDEGERRLVYMIPFHRILPSWPKAS